MQFCAGLVSVRLIDSVLVEHVIAIVSFGRHAYCAATRSSLSYVRTLAYILNGGQNLNTDEGPELGSAKSWTSDMVGDGVKAGVRWLRTMRRLYLHMSNRISTSSANIGVRRLGADTMQRLFSNHDGEEVCPLSWDGC